MNTVVVVVVFAFLLLQICWNLLSRRREIWSKERCRKEYTRLLGIHDRLWTKAEELARQNLSIPMIRRQFRRNCRKWSRHCKQWEKLDERWSILRWDADDVIRAPGQIVRYNQERQQEFERWLKDSEVGEERVTA